MKNQVSPAMTAVIVAIAVLVIGGFLYFTNRSTDGSLPTPEQAGSGRMIGGKRMPGAVGASGSAGAANASANSTSGAQ